jgi:hypothetical protein
MNSLAESMLFLIIAMLPGAAFTVWSFLLERKALKQMVRCEYRKSSRSLKLCKKVIYTSWFLYILGLHAWAIASIN